LEVLEALVDGTLGQMSINAPSTGFPVGSAFQVNMVSSTPGQSTIYAQSPQFNITKSAAASSAGASSAGASASA
jgi:hypothetical protein